MAETETRALRPAPNAAARMQEVLRRGAGESPTPQEANPSEPSSQEASVRENVALPTAAATTDKVADATSSVVGSATGSQSPPDESLPSMERPDTRQKRKNTSGSTVAPTTRNQVADATDSATYHATGSAKGNDPVRQAMLGMLAQPYPADMDDGAMTVTSVKIPKPVWERLEYARSLTKKDKQDIIAAALRLYFERIVEDEAR